MLAIPAPMIAPTGNATIAERTGLPSAAIPRPAVVVSARRYADRHREPRRDPSADQDPGEQRLSRPLPHENAIEWPGSRSPEHTCRATSSVLRCADVCSEATARVSALRDPSRSRRNELSPRDCARSAPTPTRRRRHFVRRAHAPAPRAPPPATAFSAQPVLTRPLVRTAPRHGSPARPPAPAARRFPPRTRRPERRSRRSEHRSRRSEHRPPRSEGRPPRSERRPPRSERRPPPSEPRPSFSETGLRPPARRAPLPERRSRPPERRTRPSSPRRRRPAPHQTADAPRPICPSPMTLRTSRRPRAPRYPPPPLIVCVTPAHAPLPPRPSPALQTLARSSPPARSAADPDDGRAGSAGRTKAHEVHAASP
jgi:hypothetical protein